MTLGAFVGAVLLVLTLLAALAVRIYAVLPWGRGTPVPRRGVSSRGARARAGVDAGVGVGVGAGAPTPPVSLGIFLGSGGHSAEMRTLLRALGTGYAPRVYVYCAGDEMSLRVVAETETALAAQAELASASEAREAREAREASDANDGARDDARATARATPHRVRGLRPAPATPSYTLVQLPRARHVGESRLSTLVSASRALAAAAWHTLLVPAVAHPRTPWVDVLLLNGPGTAVVLVLVAYVRRILGLRYTRIIYVESFARVTSLSLSGRILRPLVDTFVVQWPNAAGDGFDPVDTVVDTSTRPDAQRKPPRTTPQRTRTRTTTTYRGWLV